MLKIIDYGAGNLFSIANALTFLGIEFEFAKTAEEAGSGDGIILPGVGAFPRAVGMLKEIDLFDFLKTTELPMLGICLGMQLLFERSEEFGSTEGLGRIPGEVRKIEGNLRIPHIGWNELIAQNPCPVTENVPAGAYVYFVHSFRAFCPEENVANFCEYGDRIPAVVRSGSTFGCQFHPEKSGDTGLAILASFDEFCRNANRAGKAACGNGFKEEDR